MALPHGIAGIRRDERYAVQPKHGVDRWELWQLDGDDWTLVGTAPPGEAGRWANGETDMPGQLDLFADAPAFDMDAAMGRALGWALDVMGLDEHQTVKADR